MEEDLLADVGKVNYIALQLTHSAMLTVLKMKLLF